MKKSLLTAGFVAAYALFCWAVQTWHDSRTRSGDGRGWLVLIAIGLASLVLLLTLHFAQARDTGHWNEVEHDPAVSEWYRGLMQPDVPMASCCGEADAYWCDDYFAREGKAFCRITDDRPDDPRGRPHVEVGTEIEIPANKLKWDRANPTGHGVVFLSRGGYVYCYVQPGGV